MKFLPVKWGFAKSVGGKLRVHKITWKAPMPGRRLPEFFKGIASRQGKGKEGPQEEGTARAIPRGDTRMMQGVYVCVRLCGGGQKGVVDVGG